MKEWHAVFKEIKFLIFFPFLWYILFLLNIFFSISTYEIVASYHTKFCHNHTLYHHTDDTRIFSTRTGRSPWKINGNALSALQGSIYKYIKHIFPEQITHCSLCNDPVGSLVS